MKTLPSQRLRDSDYADMTAQVKAIFTSSVFQPLLDLIAKMNAAVSFASPKKVLWNAAEDALRDALRTGRVQYKLGIFSGQFNSEISKALRALGAVINKRDGTFRMDPGKVPGWVSAQAGAYQVNARELNEALKAKLARMMADIDSIIDKKQVNAKGTVERIEQGFKAAGKKLEVFPQLSTDSIERLAKEYSTNMDLWIRRFSRSMILELREKVEDNAQQGYRFDRLISGIRDRYSVTENKARFLARQETALFMSQYRRERFSEAGVQRYKWSTSRDERVRTSHKGLNGKIFRYDDPPIVDPATGRRANPGQDFNCRCVDIPILEPAVAITS